MPRMLMLVDEPGKPLDELMFTPDTLPCNEFKTLGSDFCEICSALICWVE